MNIESEFHATGIPGELQDPQDSRKYVSFYCAGI